MTAPARPQHYADAAAEHLAADRAAVTALVGSYRDTLNRGLDPLTALACVAGAAYQEMCSRRATRVIAAAVQIIAEMQAETPALVADRTEAERQVLKLAKAWRQEPGVWSGQRLINAVDTLEESDAGQAGVDRHWGPLAATGGEQP